METYNHGLGQNHDPNVGFIPVNVHDLTQTSQTNFLLPSQNAGVYAHSPVKLEHCNDGNNYGLISLSHRNIHGVQFNPNGGDMNLNNVQFAENHALNDAQLAEHRRFSAVQLAENCGLNDVQLMGNHVSLNNQMVVTQGNLNSVQLMVPHGNYVNPPNIANSITELVNRTIENCDVSLDDSGNMDTSLNDTSETSAESDPNNSSFNESDVLVKADNLSAAFTQKYMDNNVVSSANFTVSANESNQRCLDNGMTFTASDDGQYLNVGVMSIVPGSKEHDLDNSINSLATEIYNKNLDGKVSVSDNRPMCTNDDFINSTNSNLDYGQGNQATTTNKVNDSVIENDGLIDPKCVKEELDDMDDSLSNDEQITMNMLLQKVDTGNYPNDRHIFKVPSSGVFTDTSKTPNTKCVSNTQRLTLRHSKLASYLYICCYCNQKYKWKKHLDLHIMLKHSVHRVGIRCEKCSKSFTSDECLTRHKIIKHSTSDFLHKCNDCHTLFLSRGHFNRHKNATHVGCHDLCMNDSFTGFNDNADADTSDYDVEDYEPVVTKPKLVIKFKRKRKNSESGSDSDYSPLKPERNRFIVKTKKPKIKEELSDDSYLSPVKADHPKILGRPKKDSDRAVKIKEKQAEKSIVKEKKLKAKDPGLVISKDENYQAWAENELSRWRRFKAESLVARFKCVICQKDFSKRSHLKRHTMGVHSLDGDELESSILASISFTCIGCPETFLNREALNHHMKNNCAVIMERDKGGGSIECKHCKQMVEKYRIKNHLTNCGKNYECVYCDVTFNTYYDYNQHRLSEHVVKETFPCRFCGTIFQKWYHMNRHMLTHLRVRPVPCKECKMKFTKEETWKEHMIKEHEYKEEDLKGLEFAYLPIAKSRHYREQFTVIKSETKNLAEVSMEGVDSTISSLPEKPLEIAQENSTTDHDANSDTQADFAIDDDDDDDDEVDLAKSGIDVEDDVILRKLIKDGAIRAKQKYPCPTCGKILSQRSHLARHMTVHGALKNFLCPECGKRFATKYHLSRHLVSHSGTREHQCMHCGKLFAKKESLNSHMVIHSDREKYTCAFCPKTYFEKKSLDSHVQKRHMTPKEGKKRQACDICNEMFSDHICLRKHKARMHNYDLLNCKECQEHFPDKLSLKAHIVKEHGSSTAVFQCNACSKIFLTQRDHSRHLITHQEQRQHECPECGRMFKRQSHVIAHMSMHSGEKPHQCPHCGKQFRRADYLYGHLKRDHGESNPHKCHICSFACDHINRLRKHMQQAHDIVYENKCEPCNITFNSRDRLAEHLFKEHDEKVITEHDVEPVSVPLVSSNTSVNSSFENLVPPTSLKQGIQSQAKQPLQSPVKQVMQSPVKHMTPVITNLPLSSPAPQQNSVNVTPIQSPSPVQQSLTPNPNQLHTTPTPNQMHTSIHGNHPNPIQNQHNLAGQNPESSRQNMVPLPAHNPTPAHNVVRHMNPILQTAMAFNPSQFWTAYPPHPHMYHNL